MRSRGGQRLLRIVTISIAIVTGAVCAAVIAIVLPTDSPRRVIVAESANIDALPTTIGFADSDFYGLTPADVERTLTLMADTNVTTVRLMIPWAGVEPFQGNLDWSTVDKTVNAAAARGMSIIGFINSTPYWAVAPGGWQYSGRPASPAAYGEFAAKVAARYKGKISAYEIWNEPNTFYFYTPQPDPAGYTDLLEEAYPRIKAVDPNVTILAGALIAVIDWGNLTIDPVRFLNEMYAAGAKNFFDALSFHPYHYQLKFSDGVPHAGSSVNQMMGMRLSMIANGDSAKKIWNTEYGQPTSVSDEAAQAAFLTDMYTKWQEMPYAGPLMFYTTRDRNTASTTPDDTFGVFRSDWTPKQAQLVLKSAIAAGVPKSPEFQRFSQITDPAHGSVLSPVFRATPTMWAQIRTVNTLFETPNGILSSPKPVADFAVSRNATPSTSFTNGWQDFNSSNGFRIWWSQATGVHWANAAWAQAWVPELGLATSDEYAVDGATRVNFQNGYLEWTPWTGVTVHFT